MATLTKTPELPVRGEGGLRCRNRTASGAQT